MKKIILAFILAILIVAGVVVSAKDTCAAGISQKQIIKLTNQTRTRQGLNTLQADPVLTLAAQKRAEDMATKGYFAHVSPEGKEAWDFIRAEKLAYYRAGENLAVQYKRSKDVMASWMNSPGHKANLIDPTFNRIGIGIAEGKYQGRKIIFVVQFLALMPK